MTQYINKDKVVAEIEKRRSKNARNKLNLAAAFEDNYLLSFLNTLEVKEVDLEKEIHKFIDKEELHLRLWDVDRIAKHFFELGLAQKGE